MNYIKDLFYIILIFISLTFNNFYINLVLVLSLTFLIIKNNRLKHKLQEEREFFINTLNHDLRVSMLAQIRGLEILEKLAKKTNFNLELINEIYNSTRYSFEMITMLLKTTKINNGENILFYKSFESLDLINYLEKELEDLKNKNNVILKCSTSSNFEIYADEFALKKTLLILLKTFITNSKKQQFILLKSTEDGKNYKFEIIFNGKRLTYKEKKRLLSKKYRFNTVGQGLKMNFCGKIIKYHGGKITFEHKKNTNVLTIIIPILKNTLGANSHSIPILQNMESCKV